MSMKFHSMQEAERIAKEHCPAGWIYNIRNNLGWRCSWHYGPISVHMYEGDKFTAMISSDPELTGSGGPWTKGVVGYGSVLEAAEMELLLFNQYINEKKLLWAQIRNKMRGFNTP